jgi:hypothetical protein
VKHNYVRVCKYSGKLWTKATLYKLAHLKKYPGLFMKVGGALLVDLDKLDEIIEAGRVK